MATITVPIPSKPPLCKKTFSPPSGAQGEVFLAPFSVIARRLRRRGNLKKPPFAQGRWLRTAQPEGLSAGTPLLCHCEAASPPRQSQRSHPIDYLFAPLIISLCV